MNPLRLLPILFSLCVLPASAQLSFSGTQQKPVTVKADASTGLDNIYVVYDTGGVSATYRARTSGTVTWSRYSNLGGAYAEPLEPSRRGDEYTISLGPDDMGYIIQEGTDRHYCWVVNYARHICRMDALTISDEQDCDRARLNFEGQADKITYYTITGVGKELERDLILTYQTLRYDEATADYVQVEASQTYASIDKSIGAMAPLCDTRFILSGDRFLRQWGMEQHVESPNFQAIAVEAHTGAEQTPRDNDNEQKVDAGALGGSAPAEITFTAAVTDAAIFREWQLSSDAEFGSFIDRFPQLELQYTFRDNGNYYMRFVANNAAGTCEYTGETYEIFIGESVLMCPNAFSPNDDGVNDEWKVSYKSIVQYECHIFNRWGQEIFSSTDPARGWDGRHGGKYVPTGVYYYVIKARGSDGKDYKLSGDINILKSKANNNAGAGSALEE